MLNTGDILDSRYEVLTRIGQGGMSVVYKAKDLKLGREVAVKVLKKEFAQDEGFIERFKNEARSAARLSHTNIVATYDIVNSNDYHYIVMELVEGITLKDYITRKGKLSNKETLGIALQTAEGLAEAHRNGIIHRDIKSQNIIISKEGRIKIADFGIAGAANVADSTSENALIGSAHYMAPEQAEHGETNSRSDIYSLGISMYEMITGKLPYEGDSVENVVIAHIQEAMVPPNVLNNEIYPALNDIIIKATRKDPENRYQSAEELVEDLKHAAADPNGHFVKMYDSIGSTQFENEKAAGNVAFIKPLNGLGDVKPGDTMPGKVPGGDTAPMNKPELKPQEPVSEEDPDLQDVEIYDDSKTKFIILGITALVIAIVALIAVFVIRTRKDAISTAESNLATEATMTQDGDNSEMNYTLSIQGEDVMPDLSGMTESQASALLANIHMSMDSSTTDYSDKYPKGTIMNQSPAKGEVLTSDSTVYVTVSLGPKDEYILDNLKNMSEEEARETLEEAGISVADNNERSFSDEVAEGMVMGCRDLHKDENGKRVVALIVSYGKQEDYVVMPDLTGYTVQEAAEFLAEDMIAIGTVSALNNEDAAPNDILGQSVEANSYIKKGSTVDVQICVGSDGTIPDGTVLPSTFSSNITKPSESGNYLSPEYYYGSIDTSCVIGDANGPGSANNAIHVGVRLVQRVDGSVEYTMLTEPIPVAPGTRIPVSYKNIRGAYGVTDGTVEVFGTDNGVVYSSYVIGFDPID